MEESVHVTFDESLPTPTKTLEDEEVVPTLGNLELGESSGTTKALPKDWRYSTSHPPELILGDRSKPPFSGELTYSATTLSNLKISYL